jgi:acyl-CoA synthetase (AMP-forming)/AMP-acid ligase II
MGLVGHVLTTLWVGGHSTIMDPLLFLQSPLRWLREMSRERSTITSAPNFADELCCKTAEAADLYDIDLSSLSTAICGGESVWPNTIERFCTTFAPHGFVRSAFAPSYGLAEATLLVTTGKSTNGPKVFSGLLRNSAKLAVAEQRVHATSLGSPAPETGVRIIDPTGAVCPEGVIGEIEVSGKSVGKILGTDHPPGHALTGDLGFLLQNELYVVGRRKEVIILRGQNVYPADVEAAATNAHPSIQAGGVAAVAIALDGTEALLLVFEVARSVDKGDHGSLCRLVNEAVVRSTGHVPWQTIAVPAGVLRRTTSGKIQRNAVASMFLRGEIRPLAAARPLDHGSFRLDNRPQA